MILIISSPPAGAADLLLTGFEPPLYTTGPLPGKDGWTGSNAVMVQTATVRSGSQAVAINAAGLPNFTFAGHALPYSPEMNPDTIVKLTIDMLLTSSANQTSQWTPLIIEGRNGFLAQLVVDRGVAALGLESSSVGSAPVARDVWNSFELELDHQTQTVTARMNGATIGSGPFAHVPNSVNKVTLGLLVAGGTDTAYLDNLSVTSHAPPRAPLTFTRLAGPDGGPGFDDGAGSAARFNVPAGVAVDARGNRYIADTGNHTIRIVSDTGVVRTLAGSAGNAGTADGIAAARFNLPAGVAVDGSGNVYVADAGNQTIRMITPAGRVSTIAGLAGVAGSADGESGARFRTPYAIALASNGVLYIADRGNHTIRKMTGTVVSTVAGLAGAPGPADGIGSEARFNTPSGLAVDGAGNLWVADTDNHTVRRVTPERAVTTPAGSAGNAGLADGAGSVARFNHPAGVACDAGGNVYVVDSSRVRKFAGGAVVTMAGGISSGHVNGPGASARFRSPLSLAIDSGGVLHVADTGNHVIRRLTPDAMVATAAGLAASVGSSDGNGDAARFSFPSGVVMDSGGNLYVVDSFNHTIRRITPAGSVSTFAGVPGASGSVDGARAQFRLPFGVAIDRNGDLYVADSGNNTIRKITAQGITSLLAGSPLTGGSADGVGGQALFNFPTGVAVDGNLNVYVADSDNHTIRRITASGNVTTFAGSPGMQAHADGTGTAARFAGPYDVAIDSSGNVYVTDNFNHAIRKITPAGVVSTLAGEPTVNGSADGMGRAARFYRPFGIATDRDDNIWVTEQNRTIRKITPSGLVTTEAGLSGASGCVDGTTGEARFYDSPDLVIDTAGNMVVTEGGNSTIRAGRGGLFDAAAIDSGTGPPQVTRVLFSTPATATSWQWSIIRRPADSVAELSSPSVPSPTFTPDRSGVYVFRLVASRGGVMSITTVELTVVHLNRRRAVRSGP